MIYIITFIVTILFTYVAEKSFEKKNKAVGRFFSILAIIIPSTNLIKKKFNSGRKIE